MVYYASKTLNEAQRNYTTTEKELLAVVYALDKFHAYLIGSDIIIYLEELQSRGLSPTLRLQTPPFSGQTQIQMDWTIHHSSDIPQWLNRLA